MALTDWDKKNLTKEQQKGVLAATAAWDTANERGDRSGMDRAHAAADAIRNQAGYTSDDAGNFSGVIAPKAAAPSYDRYDAAVRRASQLSYDDWTKSNEYRNLVRRYTALGQRAADDTLGKVAARTDGMASSYAASAAAQQYDRYLDELDDAALAQYNRERSDAESAAKLEQALADDVYSRYRDTVSDAAKDEKTARAAVREILESGGSLSDLDLSLLRTSGMTYAELMAILRKSVS